MNTIYFDVETTGLDPFNNKITLMQIKQGNKIRLISSFTESKINELRELLENNLVVGHSLKFELKFLKQQFNITPVNIFDTNIAEVLISGGIKAGKKGTATLAAVTKQYLNLEMNKDETLRKSFQGLELTPEQIKYAALDVARLDRIHAIQKAKIKDMGLEKVSAIEMSCIPATAWLELSGLSLDLDGLKKVQIETEKKIEDAELKVKTVLKESGYKIHDLSVIQNINLNSTKQLLEAMQAIGLNVESTGDKIISSLDHPIGKAIKEYRKLKKLLSGFILAYPEHIHSVTGRIQPEFNQYGTNTGRFSCSKPNMQQVPHDKTIRSLFRARPSNKIITADYSQIELRIIAEVSQEPKFLEIYRNNGDLHRLTASLILNKPASEITKEERQQAKAVNFGFAYGLGAKSFKEKAKNEYDIDISIEQAKAFRSTFFKNYPVLNRYLLKTAHLAGQDKQIRNKSGRIVRFEPGLGQWKYENMGRNTPIQSLSADITKSAMGRLYHKLKPFDAKLINAVHDELVFEVPEDKANEISKIIKDEMEAAGREYLKSIPCIVEVMIGDVWQK